MSNSRIIVCSVCSESKSFLLGGGFAYEQTFENLFVNFLNAEEKLKVARWTAEFKSKKILKRVVFKETALFCDSCQTIDPCLFWRIDFRSTQANPLYLLAERTCAKCGNRGRPMDIYDIQTINARCSKKDCGVTLHEVKDLGLHWD